MTRGRRSRSRADSERGRLGNERRIAGHPTRGQPAQQMPLWSERMLPRAAKRRRERRTVPGRRDRSRNAGARAGRSLRRRASTRREQPEMGRGPAQQEPAVVRGRARGSPARAGDGERQPECTDHRRYEAHRGAGIPGAKAEMKRGDGSLTHARPSAPSPANRPASCAALHPARTASPARGVLSSGWPRPRRSAGDPSAPRGRVPGRE